MDSREILKLLKENGWIEKTQKGSHLHMIHPKRTGKITIPHPKNDLNKKTVASILKQAGLKK